MRLPAMFVCLSVSKITCTQKRVHGFGWHFACWQMSGYGRTDQLLSPIWITVRMPELDCFLRYRMHCNSEFYYVGRIPRTGIGHNVETSYFTQLKMCYLMTMFRCPSDILITWSRRDQDVRQISKRCHSVTHFQLCKVRSFYVIDRTNWMNLFNTGSGHSYWVPGRSSDE